MYLCLSVLFVFPGSCSYWFQPVSGFLFLYCKSGLCISVFVGFFQFLVLFPLPVPVLPCLLCMVVFLFYRSSDFLVLTLFPCPRRLLSCLLPLYLCISDYLEFDLCLLTLPLPGPIKSVFFVHCASGSSLTFTPFTVYNNNALIFLIE